MHPREEGSPLIAVAAALAALAGLLYLLELQRKDLIDELRIERIRRGEAEQRSREADVRVDGALDAITELKARASIPDA